MAGYGGDSAFEAWAEANGYDLSVGDLSPAILRQRGSAYIDGVYGARFRGVPTGGLAQERAWPRTGATFSGQPIAPDTIPVAVEHASYAAAYHEARNPGSLSISASSTSSVKREKIATLEVEYFQDSGDAVADATVRLSDVEGLLAPFLYPVGYREPTVFLV